jgi:hypothetical protein
MQQLVVQVWGGLVLEYKYSEYQIHSKSSARSQYDYCSTMGTMYKCVCVT